MRTNLPQKLLARSVQALRNFHICACGRSQALDLLQLVSDSEFRYLLRSVLDGYTLCYAALTIEIWLWNSTQFWVHRGALDSLKPS